MTTSVPGTESRDLFARDGHLTLLTLDRFECGELSLSAVELVHGHLGECSDCADRWSVFQAQATPLLPPARKSSIRWASASLGAGLAIAATVALALSLQPEQASRAPIVDGHLSASAYTTTTTLDAEPEAVELDPLLVRVSIDGRLFDPGSERITWDELVTLETEVPSPGFIAAGVWSESGSSNVAEVGGTGMLEESPGWELLGGVAQVSGDAPWILRYDAAVERSSAAATQKIWVTWCPASFEVENLAGASPAPAGVPGCITRTVELLRSRSVDDS